MREIEDLLASHEELLHGDIVGFEENYDHVSYTHTHTHRHTFKSKHC